jgi:hypothetical protein
MELIKKNKYVAPTLLTLLSAAGDFNLKSYSLHGDGHSLLVGSASYLGVVAVLSEVLGTAGVAYTNNMWNVCTSLLETVMAVRRGEVLSPLNWVGVAFIILGGIFLNSDWDTL